MGRRRTSGFSRCCRRQASSSSCRRWSSSISPTESFRAASSSIRDIEEDLLYVLDEKGHSVHLTDQGVEFMSPTITMRSFFRTSRRKCIASITIPT